MRLLVIDADVAIQASPTHTADQACVLCSDALEAVLQAGHWIVLSEQLEDEWSRHVRGYSSTWLQQMFARRRVRRLSVPEDPDLLERVFRAHTTQLTREEIAKDLHLPLAALRSDRTVLSKDARARRALASATGAVNEIRRIIWTDPSREDEGSAGGLMD